MLASTTAPDRRTHTTHRPAGSGWRRAAASFLAASLALVLAAPALAGSAAADLDGKAKLKLKGVGKDKARIALSHVQREDGINGLFELTGTFSMHGGMLPKGRRSQLLLDATSVPGVEAFLAREVASLLAEKGRSTGGGDELSIKRFLAEIADKQEDIARLEERAELERRVLARMERLVEAGATSPDEFKLAVAALDETIQSIGREHVALELLKKQLAVMRAQPQSPAVSIEITRAALKSSLSKHSTRLTLNVRLQFDAIVDGTGERIRGSYAAKAKGAAFGPENAIEEEQPTQQELAELLRKLVGDRLSDPN